MHPIKLHISPSLGSSHFWLMLCHIYANLLLRILQLLYLGSVVLKMPVLNLEVRKVWGAGSWGEEATTLGTVIEFFSPSGDLHPSVGAWGRVGSSLKEGSGRYEGSNFSASFLTAQATPSHASGSCSFPQQMPPSWWREMVSWVLNRFYNLNSWNQVCFWLSAISSPWLPKMRDSLNPTLDSFRFSACVLSWSQTPISSFPHVYSLRPWEASYKLYNKPTVL